MITSLEKNDLIILDDFGLQPMDTNTRLALLQILEERYERKSMIIASQLPISKWYDYIRDPTPADAIMDRLVANSNKIELKGESIRQCKKKNNIHLQQLLQNWIWYRLQRHDGTDSSDTMVPITVL